MPDRRDGQAGHGPPGPGGRPARGGVAHDYDLHERAAFIRAEAVRLIDIAKTGHYTSVFSAAEILAALYYRVMRIRRGEPDWPERDRLVLSKGHVAVGVYPVLADLGFFDPALLDSYTRLGNPLGDHPDMRHVPGADFSSGSLGHGLSVALGMALAARVTGLPQVRVYALLGSFVAGTTLSELADGDPRIVVLGADLKYSNRTSDFAERHPGRFFNLGIAEQNMMSVAAGIASFGLIPYVGTFASYAGLLCAEQIRTDLAYTGMRVRVLAHHAGISLGYYGTSHHATEDVAILRSIAGVTVVAPCDARSLDAALRQTVELPGPVYLRLGRGRDPDVYQPGTIGAWRLGRAHGCPRARTWRCSPTARPWRPRWRRPAPRPRTASRWPSRTCTRSSRWTTRRSSVPPGRRTASWWPRNTTRSAGSPPPSPTSWSPGESAPRCTGSASRTSTRRWDRRRTCTGTTGWTHQGSRRGSAN